MQQNICPMEKSNECSCSFLKKIIKKTMKKLIWVLPFFLGSIYLLLNYLFITQEWFQQFKFKPELSETFFVATLAYYGVIYTLTYKVKVEVLSKNRQEWINKIRELFSEFLSITSEVTNRVNYKTTFDDFQDIQRKIDHLYNLIFLYLNKNEQINIDILNTMSAIKKRFYMRGTILEIQNYIIKNYEKTQLKQDEYYQKFSNQENRTKELALEALTYAQETCLSSEIKKALELCIDTVTKATSMTDKEANTILICLKASILSKEIIDQQAHLQGTILINSIENEPDDKFEETLATAKKQLGDSFTHCLKKYRADVFEIKETIKNIENNNNYTNFFSLKVPFEGKEINMLNYQLSHLLSRLTSICLKEEWERVKSAD